MQPTHVFPSYEAANAFIKNFEDETTSKFILLKKTKDVAVEKVQSLQNNRLFWEDKSGEVPVTFDSIPFVAVGHEVRECHNGPRRRKSQAPPNNADHQYNSKRNYIQETKKLDCPMRLKMRTIIRFPEYQLNGDYTLYKRKKQSKSLKDGFNSETIQQFEVHLKIIGEHENHITSSLAGYGIPLDKSVKERITQLVLEDGLRDAGEIKRNIDLHSRTLHPDADPSFRRYFPTEQDVRNHMHHALKSQRYSDNDQLNVLGLVQAWQENSPDDYYFFRPASCDSEVEETLLFIHQTEFQQCLLHKYGRDIVVMDSTYKTSKYELPLFFLCVLTNVGYFVTATFILGRETRDQISEALEKLKARNPKWQPKAFMCDMDQREIGAIQNTFKDSSIYLCDFHREQAWDRWFSKATNAAREHKKETIQCLRRIAHSNTESALQENLTKLKGLPIYESNVRFKHWIDRQWLQNLERWVRLYRTGQLAAKVNTTNGVETQNKQLKHKYLKKAGGSKTLTTLASVLTQEFEPDSKKRYIRENVQSRGQYRKYSAKVPDFLKDRPKRFIDHCLQRLGATDQLQTVHDDSSQSFTVIGEENTYSVNLHAPSCSCPDWEKHCLPCKHMLAVVTSVEGVGWDNLPEWYRALPSFNLDVEFSFTMTTEATTEVVPEAPSDCQALNIRSDTISIIKEIQNDIYMVSDQVLETIMPFLQKSQDNLKRGLPTGSDLPTRIPAKKRRTTRKQPTQSVYTCPTEPHEGMQPTQSVYTCPTEPHEDIIEDLLATLWDGGEGGTQVVAVGPFVLTGASFESLITQLTDEVMDGYLLLLTRKAEQRVLHIPTIICTAIFTGQQHLHGLLSTEKVMDYDLCVGTVNEGGHWTLVIVNPVEKTLLYLNPMGELARTEQVLLQYWYNFLNERHQFQIEDQRPETWYLQTPAHAKQKDSNSCGVYVLQLAELYLNRQNLQFNWGPADVLIARKRIARSLLGEGDVCSTPETQSCSMQETQTLTGNQENQVLDEEVPNTPVNREENQVLDEELPNTPVNQEENQVIDEDLPNTPVNQPVQDIHEASEPKDSDNNDRISEAEQPKSPIFRKSTRQRKPKRKRSNFVYEKQKPNSRIYCVCRKKNDGGNYWECDSCAEWYHPECLNIREEKPPAEWFCNACKETTETRETIGDNIEEVVNMVESNMADGDYDLDEGYLFTKSIVEKMMPVAKQRVTDLISGEKGTEEWRKRHNAFSRDESTSLPGYGFSWFSTVAITLLEFCLISVFFTDKTRYAYKRHGRIVGMKDECLKQQFEQDQYMAKRYLKEVCLLEALAAIMSTCLQITYTQANTLLREVENRSKNKANKLGYIKSLSNKQAWGHKLKGSTVNK